MYYLETQNHQWNLNWIFFSELKITRLEAPSRVPLPSFLLICNMVMVIAIMSLCFGANLYLKAKLKAMYITDECYPATEEEEEEKHPEI